MSNVVYMNAFQDPTKLKSMADVDAMNEYIDGLDLPTLYINQIPEHITAIIEDYLSDPLFRKMLNENPDLKSMFVEIATEIHAHRRLWGETDITIQNPQKLD